MPSSSRRSLRRLAGHAAVLAVLLHGLLPAFSQALALQQATAGPWSRVCTAQPSALPWQPALPLSPTDGGELPAPWQSALCRLCLGQAVAWVLPSGRPGLTAAVTHAVAPAAPVRHDVARHAGPQVWAVPAVRAPPGRA